ncbi:MAG: cell division protein ZapD [Gammaproteobacteria bacterium]|nr:cell division protein ZapD [Gammaproteobacteria bacterium]
MMIIEIFVPSIRGMTVWDSRFTISTLLEINNIISRIDINSELVKELIRQKKAISALASLPDIDQKVLKDTIASFDNVLISLNSNSKVEFNSELLKAIQQRDSIPGGSCDFDIPIYHHWLNSSPQERIVQLERWLNLLIPFDKATTLILNTLRDSAVPQSIAVDNGFYQRSLNSKSPYQLIRVGLDTNVDFYPELSGGKHRFSIRFFQTDIEQKSVTINAPVEFKLSCCLL